ncbi:carboxymuconolactone decarboxylase family protein [Mucilaginibacter boryungensis]|uniref:Carboxymuconolactone decarboxylase family protein n=1 Tax=Mucilaginibacter boryungensis TaxID=768480 RepID=A0ABR9XDA3_9SPHI|nr:carboxymuconolactone decarboxylase family protein [Mucilaginibacter boryungensis]MBE9665152.1 carboxymuconolactone decarboxylase family protein [Mucilaginibacter boryungensis]
MKRINFFEKGPDALKAMYGLGAYLAKSPVEQKLLHLLYFRVSQINGCSYCLDMHSKDLRAAGETEQRLYMLNAWREGTVYTNRERAALAFAEGVTKTHVSDEVYATAAAEFTEQELIDLTVAVITINSYNRINITFQTPGGSYQPGQFKS